MFQIFHQVNKDIYSETDFESILCKAIPKIEILLEIKNKQFSVILTDDEFIKSLNNSYRSKNYATDVISFPASESIDNEDDLGEIYISIETAICQADSFDVPVEDELKRLIVHGILHLMGYDHEQSDKDELIMNERENFILSQI